MKAEELFAIVEKVPKDARPADLRFYAARPAMHARAAWFDFKHGLAVSEPNAELMHVGSMVKWLADSTANEDESKCRDSVTIFANWVENETNGYLVTLNGFGSCAHPHPPGETWHAPTLVAALAAACIASGATP